MATVVELRYGSVRSVASSPASGSPADPIVAMPLSTGGGAESMVAVLAGSTLMTMSIDMSSYFSQRIQVSVYAAFCAGLANSLIHCAIVQWCCLYHTSAEE